MLFLSRRFYTFSILVILLLCGGYLFGSLFLLGQITLLLLALAVVADVFLLYRTKGIEASRACADRFSNGDNNEVKLRVESRYPFPVHLSVIDEVPVIFQQRDICFKLSLDSGQAKTIVYNLRPNHRGVYDFGMIRVFASTRLGLIERRLSCGKRQKIKVYPSYLMLHRYELLAMSDNLTELGIKKIRRVGHQTEFEQIKEYVKGDDYRTINWKASARRHQLMVNVYQDERSQHKNREAAMKMLRSRLYDKMEQERNASIAADRKSQVGTGDRSERIRTYNFPQGRVTDHRIGLTLYKLEQVMNGDLDEIIDALITSDQSEKLKAQAEELS